MTATADATPERVRLPVPVSYKGLVLPCGYRVDFIAEGQLLIEIKTVDRLVPIHEAQMLTYLKLLNLPQGLLINFNVRQLIDGLKSYLHEADVTRC